MGLELVLVSTVEVDCVNKECRNAPANNDGDFGGHVFGCVFSLESLRTDDVANLKLLSAYQS